MDEQIRAGRGVGYPSSTKVQGPQEETEEARQVLKQVVQSELDTRTPEGNANRSLQDSLIFVIIKAGKKRPTTRTKFFGKIGKKVDAQEYFTEKKQKWYDKSQSRLDDPDHYQRNGAALVTFNSTFPTRCEFNMSALTWEWKGMTAQPAPEPDDILWDSLKIGKIQRIIRIVLVFIFFFLLIFLWSIPVTFIVSIANLGTLSQINGFGWLSGITNVNIIVR